MRCNTAGTPPRGGRSGHTRRSFRGGRERNGNRAKSIVPRRRSVPSRVRSGAPRRGDRESAPRATRVEHDVGVGLVGVHPGQDRDRVSLTIAVPRRHAPALGVRHASIAFPPSGWTTVRRRIPSPHATAIRRAEATTSPGSPSVPESRATADESTLSAFPRKGRRGGPRRHPADQVAHLLAGRLQSIRPCSFVSRGAYVASARPGASRRASPPAASAAPRRGPRLRGPRGSGTTFPRCPPPRSAPPGRAARAPCPSPRHPHDGDPVTVSPRATAQLIGAAPRYFGSREAWTLMHPNRGCRGSISAGCGRTPRPRSGRAPRRRCGDGVGMPRLFGWKTGIPRRRASSFTGGTAIDRPRPAGRSGLHRTRTTFSVSDRATRTGRETAASHEHRAQGGGAGTGGRRITSRRPPGRRKRDR